jgi:hypothetical protein
MSNAHTGGKAMKKSLAWHFLAEGNKLRDGSIAPADGKWLEHKGKLVLCGSGLHFSRQAFDALTYAPGPILCLVEIGGEIVEPKGEDKGICSRRKIITRMDATVLLRYFARMQAISALEYWDTEPPEVVCDYLATGDESIRAAAWDAAWDAARAAAWDAARDADRREFNHLVCECFEGPLSAIDWSAA